MEERPVVEVGSQRDDDPEPAARVAHGQLEAREEARAALLALDEREDLFELVDDEQELRPVVGEHALHGPEQAELVGVELLLQRGRRVRRDPQEGRLQLLERVGTRRHHGDVPAASADLGHEPGEHDGRLPAAARTDDGEKPLGDHALDEVGDELLATEEVVRVRLEEGVETLVRVPELGLVAGRGCAVGREDASWRRIRLASSRSSGDGSIPSSSTSSRRPSW